MFAVFSWKNAKKGAKCNEKGGQHSDSNSCTGKRMECEIRGEKIEEEV